MVRLLLVNGLLLVLLIVLRIKKYFSQHDGHSQQRCHKLVNNAPIDNSATCYRIANYYLAGNFGSHRTPQNI